MPELPDLAVYIDHLRRRIVGTALQGIRIGSPFVLRSVTPTVEEVRERRVEGVTRIAKQLVMELSGETFVVLHLMIAGRLRWHEPGRALPKGNGLAAFDFDAGTLIFTEASRKRRASLRLVAGRSALEQLNPGGLEVFDIDLADFANRLRATPHTVKRALTDQRVFAGIGNAYSDEILFHARMSPFRLGRNLSNEEMARLFAACREVLAEWTKRLGERTGDAFPGKVTAFQPQMAVHGKYRQPCPVCGAPVQRILRAENESNYCAKCQTGGRLLADRSLSRLLKATYPRRIEELEG
ncbi:MAG: formamidopyrimidine-DNA glycosylase [Gammaproteobacteria bacterium]|nr:formamidopyrimidine-DNA glycosylase [Gammaproteobacteria bacterium]